MGRNLDTYRDEYRRDHVPRGYRGSRHLAFTFGVGTAACVACLWQLQDVRPVEWLTIPLTALYANLAEYFGHRGPMHHRVRGLGLVFERHTRQHHRFFTSATMPVDTLDDLRAVLFPPLLMTFFIVTFALPVALVLALATSRNVAWLYIATTLGYFLNYEFLHLAYHLPARYAVARWPLIGRLKDLHQRHHDPALMTRCNFNISYPLGDWLFGTLHRPATGQRAESQEL